MDHEHRHIIAKELQLLASSSRRPVYFHGETMLPLLMEGDQLVVRAVQGSGISCGDIITYRFDDKFPTRRVIFVNRPKQYVIIKGDSMDHALEYHVSFSEILGKVTARRRNDMWLTENDLAWRRATRFNLLRSWWRWLITMVPGFGGRRRVRSV